jgi:hypothetical protein
MADCRFTTYTSRGPMDLSAGDKVAVTAGGVFPVSTAQQVRQLEQQYGRVAIINADGTGAVAVSRHSTNAKSAGATDIERRYGPMVATTVGGFAHLSLSHVQADRLASAIAASGSLPDAVAAALAASRFAGGGANRWARQLVSVLKDRPERLASIAAVFPDLALPSSSGAGPAAHRLPGHLVPRDLNTLLAVCDTVQAARSALSSGPAGSAAQAPQPSGLAGRVLAQLDTPTQRWINSEPPGGRRHSGYKLHIGGCRTLDDVRDVVTRVAPIVEGSATMFKAASAAGFDSSASSSGREIGVVLYLDDIQHAAEQVAQVVATLGERPGAAALPGDVEIASGYGLRYDMLADVGAGVSHDEYLTLYRADTSRLSAEHPDEVAASSTVIAAVRRVLDDAPDGGAAALMARHLAAAGIAYELNDVVPGETNPTIVMAAAAATAAGRFSGVGAPPEFLHGVLAGGEWLADREANVAAVVSYASRVARLAAAGVPPGEPGVQQYLSDPSSAPGPGVLAAAEHPDRL